MSPLIGEYAAGKGSFGTKNWWIASRPHGSQR